MSFWKFWPGRRRKASSSLRDKAGPGKLERDFLGFDLFYQLSYMSAIAVAGISWDQIFSSTAELPCTSSRYFKEVEVLSKKLNYDYAEACRRVGESVDQESVKSFLFRLSASLTSGETAADFLLREARIQAEIYGNEYERSLETLKKWTDAYIALIVSAVLIVIVGIVAGTIWKVGLTFILGLVSMTMLVGILGGWLIYRIAPKELKPLPPGESSPEQRLLSKLGKIVLPAAGGVCLLLSLQGMPLGWVLLVASVILLPAGLLGLRDDRRIDKRDEEIGVFLRSLGGIATAIGTTLAEALGRLDLRSLRALAPLAKRLRTRLLSLLDPELCWQRFVCESGSEVVKRSVKMFRDAVGLGGDPEEVGLRSSIFAIKIALLRAKRKLVSSSFTWLSLAIHGATTALLIFIVEIMGAFEDLISSMSAEVTQNSSDIPMQSYFSFNFLDLEFLHRVMVPVILLLTLLHVFTIQAAEGGGKFKALFYLSLTCFISGLNLVVIPRVSQMIFTSI